MEVGLHNIALELLRQGKRPVVIAPWTHVQQLKKLGWNLPYRVEPLPPKIWPLLSVWPQLGLKLLDYWLARLDRKYRFEFWHVTMAYPTGCAIVHYAESLGYGARYLIRCAGEDIQKKKSIGYGLRLDPSLDRLISGCLRRAQKLVAITDSVYDEYIALGIPPERIRRVPNGVPLARFQKHVDVPKVRRKYRISSDDFVLLCVGRNHKKKNYGTLIKAFAEWKSADGGNAKLVCVGKGVSNLRELALDNGVIDDVRLIEEVGARQQESEPPSFPSDELIDIYRMCDLFVFPSRVETFGIAIVEGMAAGLPVIVGDSEGCRDIVNFGEWGLMVDPEDYLGLARKISNVASDAILRDHLSAKSRIRCEDFSWERVVKLYLEIYAEDSEELSRVST
ncbi:glycosyltransferase family 4 protein [Owenweeksia hongkongensis]|uniref:glycosyltransferase family 4 protein n=1 Tax=Owenweeksia hongkongensis TaxID=253245 RepID=UPI003A90C993